MRTSYKELKNVFSTKNVIKANIKRFLKIIGIFAISLLLLSLIYESEHSDGFSIKFFGILFIIISFVIAIAIILENKSMTIFKANILNVNNFLVNRYNYTINNNLMTKQIGKFFYSFEYDIGTIINKNLTKIDDLYNSREFCICIICKIYNISYMEYSELDTLMKQGTNEIIMMPEEKSIKMIGEFSDIYKPEEILRFICQKLELFESNLKKVLEKEPSASDIEFEKKMFNVLGKEKTEEYVTLRAFEKSSEANYKYNQIDFSKSTFNNESIRGKNIVFKNYTPNSYFKRIFQNVLIANAIIMLVYFTFYILNGYNMQSKFTTILVMLTLILITLPALLEELLLPSYVLTKRIGLKEEKKEKFYGTLNNGIAFHVKPYRNKRFFKNNFPSPLSLHRMKYFTQTNLKLALEIENIENYLSVEEIHFITQNSNVEYSGKSLILYEEIQNANVAKEEMLENTINTMLKKLAYILGIYNEDIIIKKDYKYNIKIVNLINRCFDKVTFILIFIPSIYILYLYGTIIYTFVIDIIRCL